MDHSERKTGKGVTLQPKPLLSRRTILLIADCVPLFDVISVILCSYIATSIYGYWISPGALPSGVVAYADQPSLASGVFAAIILFDKRFTSIPLSNPASSVIRRYAARFLLFISAAYLISASHDSPNGFPASWFTLWIVGCLVATAGLRTILSASFRRLHGEGTPVETVAVVGTGPLADRLMSHLRRTRGGSIEILGAFEDPLKAGEKSACQRTGSIDDLIELGKSRSLDWILLALPDSADGCLQSIVHRLKALAVPVGHCPQTVGLSMHSDKIRSLGAGVSASPLIDSTNANDEHAPGSLIERSTRQSVISLMKHVPTSGLNSPERTPRAREVRRPPPSSSTVTLTLDNYDLSTFSEMAADFGSERFGYVVTPNADHLIRLHQDSPFRALYAAATYILLDSRFISQLLRFTRNVRVPACPGSDLTAALFTKVIGPNDPVVFIGGSAGQAAHLAARYGLTQLMHFSPPMGFIGDPAAVETCLQFVESCSPFRFCLLAVGSPQQEVVAHRLKTRNIARGLVLCIGSSVNFLTGTERRAPSWVCRIGMEWLFRLLQSPRRLGHRYLVRGPKLFRMLRHTKVLLRARTIPQRTRHSCVPATQRLPDASRNIGANLAHLRTRPINDTRYATSETRNTHRQQ